MREMLRHYFNIGTSDTPKYALIGDGVTSLTENFNPETETKHYIHQASGTTRIKSYTPSMNFSKDYIKDEEFQTWIDKKVKVLPIGKDAESDYIRVNIAETPISEGVYNAVKRGCTYQFDSIGGDAGSDVVNSMTIGGVGDGIQGTFNVETLTFTPAV